MAESARAGRPYESKAWRTILREGRLPKPAKQLIERDLDHGGSSTNTRVSNHRLTVGCRPECGWNLCSLISGSAQF